MLTQEQKITFNKLDVAYREIENMDNQYEVMRYILSCLSSSQLETTKKLIQVIRQSEKETEADKIKQKIKDKGFNTDKIEVYSI